MSGVIGGRLYMLTGYENVLTPEGDICHECGFVATRRFYRYDPATNAWQSRPWCPNFHVGGAAGVIDGKLYVVGGGDKSGISRKLDIYDSATNHWKSGAAMPAARTTATAVVLGKKLYVVGGWGANDEGGETFVYTPATDRWTTVASMPTARRLLGAARVAVDGQAYIVTLGGLEIGQTFGASNENEVYAR